MVEQEVEDLDQQFTSEDDSNTSYNVGWASHLQEEPSMLDFAMDLAERRYYGD